MLIAALLKGKDNFVNEFKNEPFAGTVVFLFILLVTIFFIFISVAAFITGNFFGKAAVIGFWTIVYLVFRMLMKARNECVS